MNQNPAARRLLYPAIPLYRFALALRELRLRTNLEPVRRLKFPVISIGNLSTGGSGKTPLAVALAKVLSRRGLRVDILSRGYGRSSKVAARVRPDGTTSEFGDEPLLIAREAGLPVYVAPQRYDAGLMAEADARAIAPCLVHSRSVQLNGSPQTSTAEVNDMPIVHILDDGFQHRQLARSVNILLLDRVDWEDSLLPAGNLREPRRAANRADVIAIPAEDPDLESELKSWGWLGPVWRLRRTMKIFGVGSSIAAFCGIARPQQFFAGLEASGKHITTRSAFSDHHVYSTRDLDHLVAAALRSNASALVTTEKDLVRMGPLVAHIPDSMPLKTARLRLEIENQDAAIDWLMKKLAIPSATLPL